MASFPSPQVLNTFDIVSTTCIYNSTGATGITFGGVGTSNEMCINFLFYYPASPYDMCYTMPQGSTSGSGISTTNSLDWCALQKKKKKKLMALLASHHPSPHRTLEPPTGCDARTHRPDEALISRPKFCSKPRPNPLQVPPCLVAHGGHGDQKRACHGAGQCHSLVPIHPAGAPPSQRTLPPISRLRSLPASTNPSASASHARTGYHHPARLLGALPSNLPSHVLTRALSRQN